MMTQETKYTSYHMYLEIQLELIICGGCHAVHAEWGTHLELAVFANKFGVDVLIITN